MTEPHWNYDYSQTLWMKMFLARPDFPNGRSEVLISFEQALAIIKTIDRLTLGRLKIVYLVGWQGLGHDDCYPEMEVVNDFLKRDCDADGRESLLWLVEEAKKYNTVVSYHGNLADCYDANASFPAFAAANAVVNDPDGKPAVIERFNDRNAYKTSYKQFWDSGLFKQLWDRFCDAVPVREAGTVHLDNFCIAQNMNPYTSVEEEDEARNKMLDYIASMGIDVTTEYTYRELELRADSREHPIGKYYGLFVDELPAGDWRDAPIRALGRIPASWWTSNMTAQECVDIPPQLYSGHLTDTALGAVFYGAMHGEDIWMNHGVDPQVWIPLFIRDYCTYQLPYFYLNRHKRLSIEGDGETGYTAYFSGGVVTRGRDRSIAKDGLTLKRENDLLLPLDAEASTLIAFSENGRTGEWNVPDAADGTYRVTEVGLTENRDLGAAEIRDGVVRLTVAPGQMLALTKT